MIGTYILYGFLIWFLYNLVFRFIIPVYRASRKMKQQFGEMQDRMRQTMNPNQHTTASAAASGGQAPHRPSSKGPKDDYLDFEEVK
ncbi:MAG: hypothetical protein EOO05_13850 [Chitinophagaceae bacterium]|nr:MAG: hypothetical protein EOO05_13850 [Chitinophagaceae bacterium]